MCNLPAAYVEQIIEKNRLLGKRIEELEKRLNIYESPHIPSSKQIIKQKREEPKEQKKGAPEGHKGATRKPPKPTKFVDLKPECCPKCGSRKIRVLGEPSKKIVEDVQIVRTVTQFTLYNFFCDKCKRPYTTTSPDLPKQGVFGPNLLSLWSQLHYYGTIPFERLSLISRNCLGVEISPPGIMSSVYRAAEIFEPYYNRIEGRVIGSDYVRSDETRYPFNGESYWLWNISTPKDTLVKIRNTRSSKVLKETFGEFLDAVLNTDCFSAYEKFPAREYQKCWAHILRDAKDLAKNSEEGKWLYGKLCRMYRYISQAKKDKQENTPKIEVWKWRQKKGILSWLGNVYESKATMNLVLRINKYMDQWFTCLKYQCVEPTNNASEREIRKSVTARKISGQHRSIEGLHSREIMASTIITCQKRGKNPFEFVRKGIGKYNSRFN